ncbi:MAG: TIGR01777 family protein [Desulfobulbaceae bacterium]|uniref:TIGR01777 family protein n=1 Tax=Candidatus Desulfobia pelagia TaxID=2841692 RepID=A0A8J6NCL9_9BACT|nr:TIGR01777 family protein [Candidatus Desulfobia pelagia]
MADKNKHTIALSGSTGFVGKRLCEFLQQKGWSVIPLAREDFKAPASDLARKIQNADVIINLAGAPIIKRWTAGYKKILFDSRINVTRKLVEACSEMTRKPEAFISTSAIGFYADHGHHTETHFVQADNFLGNLSQKWEEEAMKAERLGIRTMIFRFGVILGKNGGALQQMLLPFRLGLGGHIGSGLQAFSWIHIEDLTQAYVTAITTPSFNGVYNLTSPNPTTNRGLTKALGKALCRPTIFRVPRLILKLHFGEGATVLTGGQHVLPERLLQSDFTFQFPTIAEAVKDCVS